MLIALLIIYFVTMVASMAVSAAQAEGAQRVLLFALPVIFTPFIISFPAGLIVYWITTNVWTIGQQYVVKAFWPGARRWRLSRTSRPREAPASPAAQEEEAASSGGVRGTRGPAVGPRPSCSPSPHAPPASTTLRRTARKLPSHGAATRLAPDGRRGRTSRPCRPSPPSACARSSSASSTPSGCEGEIDGRRGRRAHPRDGRRGGRRAADRPPRPDHRRDAAPLLPRRVSRPQGPQAGGRRRRRLPRAPPRAWSSARPTAPPSGRSRAARRSSSSR